MKAEKEKRIKKINVRLTMSEYNNIKKSGTRYSDIFYYGLYGISKEDNKKLIAEIKRVGNNLNQIARLVNERKAIDIIKELQGVLNDIKNVKSQKPN